MLYRPVYGHAASRYRPESTAAALLASPLLGLESIPCLGSSGPGMGGYLRSVKSGRSGWGSPCMAGRTSLVESTSAPSNPSTYSTSPAVAPRLTSAPAPAPAVYTSPCTCGLDSYPFFCSAPVGSFLEAAILGSSFLLSTLPTCFGYYVGPLSYCFPWSRTGCSLCLFVFLPIPITSSLPFIAATAQSALSSSFAPGPPCPSSNYYASGLWSS